MKTIITICLSFISSLSFAQDDVGYKTKEPFAKVVDTVPFKGASILVVRTTFSKAENYKLMKQTLARLGIELAGYRELYGQINTKLIPINHTVSPSGYYTITILCRETEIIMSCRDKADNGFKNKNGITMFKKMKEIGDQIEGKIYYTN